MRLIIARSVVRAHSGPPKKDSPKGLGIEVGDIAQLGERLPCKQEVAGSNPTISTIEIKSKHLRRLKCFDLTSKGVGGCTLKTEQCEASEVRQQRGAILKGMASEEF